jgi:hypothetical protein
VLVVVLLFVCFPSAFARIAEGLTSAPHSMALQCATATVALTTIWALVARRYGLTRSAAATQVSFILWQ